MLDDTRTSSNEKETGDIANELARELVDGDFLLLYGELGSGKTVFSKALGKALGVTDEITSPTFNVVAEYEVKGDDSIETFRHIDLYRMPEGLSGETTVLEAMEEDQGDRRVTVVEWAERLSVKMRPTFEIYFKLGRVNSERLITIKRISKNG